MSRRVLIAGHGDAGRQLAEQLRRSGAEVIGFLDDFDRSPEVLGTLPQAAAVARATGADLLCFAIPSAAAQVLRDFVATVRELGLEVAIVPSEFRILARGTVGLEDLTDVDVLHLIGRAPVRHDVLASADFIRGKRVLVTGAAGSIGSRLVSQLAALDPAAVVGVDWWEHGVFQQQQRHRGDGRLRFRIADVKQRGLLRRIFAQERPDVVFHAAAYKHVPLMEENPLEAINNNVGGTLAVMEEAAEAGVSHLVYVSTDKAVNPANVMGATKRLGELLLLEFQSRYRGTRFNAVRFGNVIESNGSVMQIFREQIARGEALTVTDPEVTRFFMTLDEASQLIIQSAFVGEPGELYVLDMGEPIRILDLARSLIAAVSPGLEVRITGLRPGEKMYEELSYDPGRVRATSNEKIFTVGRADRASRSVASAEVVERIRALLDSTSQYAVQPAEAVAALRDGFGFGLLQWREPGARADAREVREAEAAD